jgi:dimethylglycine catabolism A
VADRRFDRLLPVSAWPTKEQAAKSKWFSPVSLGNATAQTRTWVPAMVPWRATLEGFVTGDVLDWYGRFAKGKPGVIVVEATGIRDVPSGPLLRASDDRYLDGLTQLVSRVKNESQGETKLFIQLIDFLAIKRRPKREDFINRFLKVTSDIRTQLQMELSLEQDIRIHLNSLRDDELKLILPKREFEAMQFGMRERVTDTELKHIEELPRVLPSLFAQAAVRCSNAKFDGIELHFAHAYTMASFLSRLNVRTDGYGGAKENRVKLVLEVFHSVRKAIPNSMALGCRFLSDEIIEGGNTVEDASFFALEFAQAGMDFLSLSRGGKFEDAKQPKVGHAAYPYTGISGHECMPTATIEGTPWGRNVNSINIIKKHLMANGFQTPIVACGGIATFEQAESILQNGSADVVASARQALADPDWFLKIREGRSHEIRRCLFTNYCEGLDQSHQVVTCQLWDRKKGFDDDHTVPRTKDGRRTVAP